MREVATVAGDGKAHQHGGAGALGETSGWDALTRMERQVTDLVAEGLTNPEIGARLYISRRTVETHLSHVFAKIGVSSRAQVAAEAARREG